MPIFEYNGKKYNVRDEHIDSFMKDFPDASTIMYHPQIEMFARFKTKSSFHKTKRII